MNLEQRYKLHRKIRYMLALPIVLLFGWWTYVITRAVLLSFGMSLYLQTILSLFIAIIFVLFVLKNLYKRYKIFLYSKLFIEKPNISICIFIIENLSLIILYLSFLLCCLIGNLTNDYSVIGIVFSFMVAPICIGVFVISYMFNEKKETTHKSQSL